MAFPEDWGPPPTFSALRVTPEGVPLSLHTKSLSCAAEREAKQPTALKAAALEGNIPGGPTDEQAGDEKASVFFAVNGCPTASNEMVVKKGEYEGGFSIWECTWDLLGFLQKTDKEEAKQVRCLVATGHVLDLGCGHGLLGIWALKNGASAVVFQDLNNDVLNLATRWNILKNTEGDLLGATLPHQHELFAFVHSGVSAPAATDSGDLGAASVDNVENVLQQVGNGEHKKGESFSLLQGRALCVAASWENYPEICCSCQKAQPQAPAEKEARKKTGTESEARIMTGSGRERSGATALAETKVATRTLCQSKARGIQFSVILCSEGIYREETFEPLAEIFRRLLHKDGIALVASKRYYFGVGGGSLAFISFLREKYVDSLSVEVAASFRGVNSNNFRDVLLIRNKDTLEAQM